MQRRVPRVLIALGVVLAAVAGMVAGPATAATPKKKPAKLTIQVLSGRADHVSGGTALVAIDPLRSTKNLKVTAAGKSKTRLFGVDPNGRVVGLITNLPLGKSTLIAKTKTRAAKITLTNHPIGGPVFSGPQLQPWKCQATAKDAQCNEPVKYDYLYKSTNALESGLKEYDPANPPDDVAETTTDQGVKVSFIVRRETGYINRDQYQLAVLYEPGQPWTARQPQKPWNRKLLITHGAGCGADRQTGNAPSVTEGAAETALARGHMTMSHALNNAGHNCNIATEAESLVMTKEHIVERYGTLRYTIGTGCSGGSLAIQWISNAYPGIYQGILPSCSFPDAWGTATQFLDYHQTLTYYKHPGRWGTGILWTPDQMAAVQGHATIVNSQVSDSAQFHVVIPTDPCKGITDQERYHPDTNPGGVRCTIQDAAINVFGPRPQSVWSAQEKQIGRGFAGTPTDNVGVQYGLQALQQGRITPAQFVDLNAKIGGISLVDGEYTPERMAADTDTLARAYRSGMINETNNMDETAIIDCRGPDPGAFHDAYRAFAVRERLKREHGDHDNQVIWEGPVLILGDAQCEVNSFIAMDRWLAAVEKDASKRSLADKVARNRPDDVKDRCYSGTGQKLTDGLCPDAVVPIYGTPRTVAGDALTTDNNKCRLKPLDRGDAYGPIGFSDAEWAELQRIFPTGVCDFTKPGVEQQGAVPWQTYQDAKGGVVYGGRPMPPAPKSKTVRVKRR